MVTRAQLLAQLASLPPECEGCSAPLSGDVCEYCGRPTITTPVGPLPDEPPDIRRTNISDDPCQTCGLVHSKDPNARPVCRCLYCGQIGPVAMSTTDARLGSGVVCMACVRGGSPPPGVPPQPMPWETA